MKLYPLKIASVFVTTYVLFALIMVFFYTTVTTSFLDEQAARTLSDANRAIAVRIDNQLEFDLVRVKAVIEENAPADIEDAFDTFSASDVSASIVGTLVDGGIVIEGVTHMFVDDFDETDYLYPVSFFSLDEAFGGYPDETLYLTFLHEQTIVFFDAYAYVEPLIDQQGLLRDHYFLMSKDNQIFLEQDTDATNNKFFDYLRASDVSDEDIDAMTERLYANETFTENTRIFGQEMLITFAPLSDTLSERNLYVVQTFTKETALAAVAALTFMLIAVFALSFAAFAGGLWILYRTILNKVNDIEITRIKHYYAKPYIIKIRRDGRIKWFNRTFRQHLPSALTVKNVLDFDMTSDITEDVMNWIGQQHAFTAIFREGERTIHIHFMSLKTTGGYMLMGDDVTLEENRKAYYRSLALVHPLTDLPNRNSLKWDLRIILTDKDAFRRHALIAVHIAGLTKNSIGFNETVYNETVKSTKDVLVEILAGYEATLYHTESETFAVLMKDLGDFGQTKDWIDKALTRFKKAVIVEQNIFNINLKIGVFEIIPENYAYLSDETCYDNMMLALNHARESGSIDVMTYDIRMSQYATYEQAMEDDLARAIRNDEFEMYFQPQYHFIEKRIVSFESLIRWKNPKYIQESPMTYIRLAERNNMIIDIGRIALEKSFEVARQFAEEDVKISINVSPLQIVQVGFVNDLIESFERYGLKKHSISIEITESFLMSSFEAVIPKLKALQDYGIDIHLDDFGTGYSSLQYLSELPINKIKIDKSFLVNLMTDHHKRAIVQMVSNLAKNLGIEVIAEGIEDDRQMLYVIKSGCQIGQGYHISPAVPVDQAKALIEKYNHQKAPLSGVKSKTGR